MSELKPRHRLNVLQIWVGILIPILAVSIPYIIKYAFPEHKLVYEKVGPITVDRITAVELIIENGGGKPERNVKIWIKKNNLIAKLDKLDKGQIISPEIVIDTKAKYTLNRDENYHIISLGDLRPKELITITILLRGYYNLFSSYSKYQELSIKSDDNIAESREGPEIFNFLYPFGFWMFVLLMVLIGIYGIYYEYLMDPKKKEKLILDQIDKLKK